MEQEFKNKSRSIRIDPSPASWDTLRKRLEQKRKSRRIQLIPMLAIAASILGIIFLVSMLFIKNTGDQIIPATSMAKTTEFEDWTGDTDIYWQISQLNEAYTRLNMPLPSAKKNL
jgi:hypothetical protein